MAEYYRGVKLPEGATLAPPGSESGGLPPLTVEEIEASGITDNIDLTKPESEQTDFEKALLNVEYDEDDTPAILAKRCKEKGNAMFKRGEAYFGNALRHYKDALRHASRVKKPDEDDIQVHSTSFSNRAAIYFARKQYERVIADCEAALGVWPSNVRACFRASRSHLLLEHWESAVEFAQRGLALDPMSKPLKRMVTQANKQIKAIAKKKKQAEAKEQAKLKEAQKLRDACEQRHIVLGLPLYDAPTTHVGSAKMDRDGTMHWPCMFLYDEYGTSDFVAQFCELHTFRQQLEVVLPDGGAPAPWDVDGAYRVSNVDVYYVERATQALPKELTFLSEGDRRLLDLTEAAEADEPDSKDLTWVKVPLDAPLLLAMCQKHHVIPRYPVFHVVARNREYYRAFYEKRQGKIVKLKLPQGV